VISGGGGGTGGGYAASAVGIGLLLVLMRDLRMRNNELMEARAELALTAVAAERERFARDLHDLLGHSLSVIAIKAELAGRLFDLDPERAAAEVADVEGVARESLREVREAVSGYRQPTLEKELEGARVALSAAGIEAEFERAPVTLNPDVEAVLAWVVREGATNVIRHSRATHCQVRVRANLADAGVEVVDDGQGPVCLHGEEVAPTGHGITGLTERAEQLRGRIEAGGLPDGRGFRLAVSVPVGAGAG
jgi:two-component system sensor histidine kinase DesK